MERTKCDPKNTTLFSQMLGNPGYILNIKCKWFTCTYFLYPLPLQRKKNLRKVGSIQLCLGGDRRIRLPSHLARVGFGHREVEPLPKNWSGRYHCQHQGPYLYNCHVHGREKKVGLSLRLGVARKSNQHTRFCGDCTREPLRSTGKIWLRLGQGVVNHRC